jgi:hypothetical protein
MRQAHAVVEPASSAQYTAGDAEENADGAIHVDEALEPAYYSGVKYQYAYY